MLRFVGLVFLSFLSLASLAQPAGFSSVAFSTGYPGQAMGIVFDDNGTGYVWEKAGRVWILDAAGNKSASPLIDISEEVGDWRDFGLVGFALDPSFLSNGYIYLFYVVDRHYFMNYGTGAYNSAANEYFDAAFGRITRYTATSASGYTTVDYSSRHILLGESINTGVPILHLSHGVGTLLFGEDETLLASTGDGASFFGTDVGGAAHGTYTAQALVDGIITSNEDVGSFRSQMLSSMNGKVLRIDKATGDGVPSNPWYDASEPRATRSRVWALGLRNPARMALKPGTGTPNPADGNPGVLMVGDVGWDSWEELNIVKQGGMNFGWPIYEGVGKHATYDPDNTLNLDAPTPGGCGQTHYRFNQLLQPWNGSAPSFPDPCGGGNIDPATYDLMVYYGPTVTWNHSSATAYASFKDNTYEVVGSSVTKGSQFQGNSSIGGTWYMGSQYSADYANLYFHADYGRRWINVFSFNADWELDSVGVFDGATVGRPINMASHPTKDEIFYIRHSNEVRKYTYSPTGNQVPTAVATSDVYYSASNSLTVNFDGTGSSDPDSDPLDYLWDFGDSSPTSTAASPSHTFSTVGSGAATFTVSLTVTDPGGLSSSTTMQVFLNNTPPTISSTSVDGISTYSVISPETVPLTAVVSDAEHALGDLTFAWQAVLHHDNHTHPEPIDNNQTSSTLISPIGCDGPTYWYRIYLTVTDPEGLATYFQKDIFPLCAPLVVEDHKTYTLSEVVEIDIFANDYSNDALDLSSFAFRELPSHGAVSFDPGTQKVTYIQDGTPTLADTFYYQIDDVDGDTSAWAMVEMEWIGPPTVTLQKPLDGATVDNKMVKLEYSVTGDTTLVTGVEFQLNSDPVKQDPTVSGIYRYYNIPIGSERFIARLLGAGNTPLAFDEAKDTADVTFPIVGADVKLLTGTALNVGDSWETITLDSTYNSMVVVASVVLNSATDRPAVARIRNATSGNTFQLRVQNPGGTALSGYRVEYMVVEEGTYTIAADGIKMEAQKVNSTRTASSSGGWSSNKEIRAYNNAYVSPVVMAQVMTYNDPDWSVAWSSSQLIDVPANNQKIFVGKHVGEDTDDTRADETIGFIVFDQGSYIIRGRPFVAAVGFEGILGVDDNSSGYNYSLSNMEAPKYGVLSATAMNDDNGGWPVMLGSTPLDQTAFTLAIDEDQIADSERNHEAEQVGYVIFDTLLSELNSLPVEWASFTATPEDQRVRLNWATALESNNDFFTIERSQDGGLFQQVASVPAVGNSQQVQSYQAYDEEPLLGKSYYRMKQTDLDGSFSFSNTVEVYFDGTSMTIFPNPVRTDETIYIDLFLDDTRHADLKLINQLGQTIKFEKYAFDQAENRLEVSTAGLSPGTYFIHIVADRKQFVKKLLINPR